MKIRKLFSMILVLSMLAVFPQTVVFGETGVSVTLGSSYMPNGMTAWAGDGSGVIKTYNGISGLETNPPWPGAQYIYANVGNEYIFDGVNKVNITISYYDQYAGTSFKVVYDSTNAAYTYSNVAKTVLSGSGTWKTVTYTFDDAKFAGRQNNSADFRIETDAPVCFSSISVIKTTEISTPTSVNVDPSTTITMNQYSVRNLSAAVLDQFGNIMRAAGITWSSSNTGVATVDSSGKITAVNAGTAVITAKYNSLLTEVNVQIIDGGSVVSTILGYNQLNNGIKAWTGDGGSASKVNYLGKTGLQTNPSNGAAYIYFNVDNRFIYDGKHKVIITIEYFDAVVDGNKKFSLTYDSVVYDWAGGPNTETYLTKTNTWKTAVYTLEDVEFANRENGGDFRIGTTVPICFGSVTVEKIPILTLEGGSAKTGNIYTENETPGINLYFGNQFNTPHTLSASYKVADYAGYIVANGEFQIDLPALTENVIYPFTFGNLMKGTYTLFVDAIDSTGTLKLSESFNFSLISDLTGKQVAQFFGMNAHYSVSWSNIDQGLPVMVQSGTTKMRDQKATVADKASLYGIDMLTILSLNRFSTEPFDTPAYWTDFANRVTTYATEMAGKTEYFEIGNEYNSVGSAENYLKYLSRAYPIIKSIDPNTKVVAGAAFQYDSTWLKQLIDLGACDYLDAISFHKYSNLNPENANLVNNFNDLQNYLTSKGITKDIDLLLTETGYATQDPGWGGLPEITSASYAVQLYVAGLINNQLIDRIYWYDFMNDGTDPTYYETNGGVVRANMTAKPSFVALNAISGILAGTQYVQSFNTLDSNIRIYKFHRSADNKDIFILWANNGSQSINLNMGTDQVSIADIFGNVQDYDTINGSVSLIASEQPFYIEGNFPQDPVLVATPAFTIDTSIVKVVPGDNVTIHITKAGGAENLSGTYSVKLPDGWILTSGAQFSPGTTDTLTFSAPVSASTKTGEIRIYPTSTAGNPYGILRVPTELLDPSIVQMSLKENSAGDGYDLVVEIINQSSMTSLPGGTVTILEPLSAGASQPFDVITPGSTARLTFTAPPLDIYTPVYVKVNIARTDGSSQVIERNVTSLTAVKADQPITIDGVINDSEWNNAGTFSLDQLSQVKLMTDWGGISDLSANVYTKWDQNYLYLAASVTDQTHYNPYTPDNSWQGDGIQFSIDPLRVQAPGTIQGTENNIALNSDTGAVLKKGGYDGFLTGSNISIIRNGTNTNYEMAIKWTDILPAGMTPAPGTDIGFSFLVNDNDGSTRRGWMEYMSGIGLTKNPNLYGDLILTDSPTPLPASLPAPWQISDIGSPLGSGSASYNTGEFTVSGGGTDIWGTSDKFAYVYQGFSGDGSISMKITKLPDNTSAWAKAGIMFRETLSADSKYVDFVVMPGGTLSMQWRNSTGGSCGSYSNLGNVSVNDYIKIARTGSLFEIYKSSDGVNWGSALASHTTAMNDANLKVGMCVTAHVADSTTTNAKFSDVTIAGGNSTPTPEPTPTPNAAPVLDPIGDKVVEEGQLLTCTVNATDENGDSLEYSVIDLPAGSSFDAATRTFTWIPEFHQAGNYAINIQVTDGNLSDSEVVNISVGNVTAKELTAHLSDNIKGLSINENKKELIVKHLDDVTSSLEEEKDKNATVKMKVFMQKIKIFTPEFISDDQAESILNTSLDIFMAIKADAQGKDESWTDKKVEDIMEKLEKFKAGKVDGTICDSILKEIDELISIVK